MPEIVQNFQGAYTADDFWAKYSSVNPRMCLLVLVTPKAAFGGSGAALGFTSNSRNMSDVPGFPGITFKATPAIAPTTCEIALDTPSNLELTGIFNDDSFTEEEVLAGKWNFAELKIMSACWDNLDLGQVVWHKGNLGETKTMQTFFTAESRGPLALLSQEVARFTARLCRVHEFQDSECGHTSTTVNLDGTDYNLSHTLTVSAFDPDNPFQITFTKLSGAANNVPNFFFKPGKITAQGSTANGQISREILTSTTGASTITIQLRRRFPFPVAIGQQFVAKRGCNRTLDMCAEYENVINKQSEDFTPTPEAANRRQGA